MDTDNDFFFATNFLASHISKACWECWGSEYIAYGPICPNENTKKDTKNAVSWQQAIFFWPGGKGVGWKDEEETDEKELGGRCVQMWSETEEGAEQLWC